MVYKDGSCYNFLWFLIFKISVFWWLNYVMEYIIICKIFDFIGLL